jgi:hypothetical protein
MDLLIKGILNYSFSESQPSDNRLFENILMQDILNTIVVPSHVGAVKKQIT